MGQASSVTDAIAFPVVRVQGFYKRYRKQVAVESVDLTIQPNEIYGLIGPDGAGKSSLMKSIAGVMSFEKGKVEMFGVNAGSLISMTPMVPTLEDVFVYRIMALEKRSNHD